MLALTEVRSQDQGELAKSYRKADSIAQLYAGHSLYNLPELANKLTEPLIKERDKIRVIYTWVSTNISNDFDTYIRNKVKRRRYRNDRQKLAEWNKKISKVIFKNLLTEHKSICSGYAYLFDELAKHAGLNSKIINGYGKNSEKETLIEGNPNHSWNAVQVEGKWFFIDTTWSSGLYKIGERKFISNFRDTYFLVVPELFILNHYPVKISDAFTDHTTGLNHFLQSPYIRESAIQFGMKPMFPLSYKIELSKGDQLVIKLQLDKMKWVDRIALKINRKPVNAEVKKLNPNSISIQYDMNKKGTFSAQIYLDNEQALSYLVTVRK